MNHEEFDELVSKHLKSQIDPAGEDGIACAFRHGDKIQLIVHRLELGAMLHLIAALCKTVENPLLVMAALTRCLASTPFKKTDGRITERDSSITAGTRGDQITGLRAVCRSAY